MEEDTHKKTFWKVDFSKKAAKQAKSLPPVIHANFAILKAELETEGPVQAEWFHYGKLTGKKGEFYHCHLNKGKPRYVAVWKVVKDSVLIIEVRYVGTHEGVDYRQFK